MNVRSAILQRLESDQATLEQLLELDEEKRNKAREELTNAIKLENA